MTQWYIIQCESGREARAEAALASMGYPGAWHPQRRQRLSQRVYERLLANRSKWKGGKKPKPFKLVPWVYGYVFLPADEIAPHRINEHPGNFWMRVLCVNGDPYRLSDEDMMQMKTLPEKLKQMLDEAERKAREEWEAKRPVVGQLGIIVDGVGVGQKLIVDRIENGQVRMGYFKVPEQMVERV